MTDALCSNCGTHSIGMKMVTCRMLDRCRASQNLEISNHYTFNELQEISQAGKQVFVDQGRPLCVRCAEQNNYTCWICELELAQEGNKK